MGADCETHLAIDEGVKLAMTLGFLRQDTAVMDMDSSFNLQHLHKYLAEHAYGPCMRRYSSSAEESAGRPVRSLEFCLTIW